MPDVSPREARAGHELQEKADPSSHGFSGCNRGLERRAALRRQSVEEMGASISATMRRLFAREEI